VQGVCVGLKVFLHGLLSILLGSNAAKDCFWRLWPIVTTGKSFTETCLQAFGRNHTEPQTTNSRIHHHWQGRLPAQHRARATESFIAIGALGNPERQKHDPTDVAWKMAEQGNASAQYILGVRYESGRGVAKDEAAAVAWYRKAAAQGHGLGQYTLGVMYDNGRGVESDEAAAVAWYEKAAAQGYASAQYVLGTINECGRGVEKDEAMAATWYCISAEQGYAPAKLRFGVIS